jgi:hypothetical protein
MRCVYRGDVQGREWIVTVLAVLEGQVLDRDGRDLRDDVQRLSPANLWYNNSRDLRGYMRELSLAHLLGCGE